MNDKFYKLPLYKQERIIKAAYRVFAGNEYKRASMSAIADAAGISKSLLFYYFTNKKELYLYLVYNAESLTYNTAKKYHVWETNDFFKMLERNLQAKCSLSLRYPDICMFSLKAYYERNEEVKKDVRNLISKTNQEDEQSFFRSLDCSVFRNDIDVKVMYHEISLACEGYLYRCFHEGKIEVKQMEEDFMLLLEHWKKTYLRRRQE